MPWNLIPRTLAPIGALLLTNCSMDRGPGEKVSTGPVEHMHQMLEMDKSEAVRMHIKMGAGELHMKGGSADLLEADYTYNVPTWKPVLRYEKSAVRSSIELEQPGSSKGSLGDIKYEWNLALNNAKPLSLTLDFGAGEALLDLGDVNVQRVDANMGVGHVKLDLRGSGTKDCQVNIQGGVGQAEVFLPKDAGITAEAHGGLGEIHTEGLTKHGDRFFNEAYNHHPTRTIRLNVSGGIGEIALHADK